jgi:uncharacterized protein (DUF885 family)
MRIHIYPVCVWIFLLLSTSSCVPVKNPKESPLAVWIEKYQSIKDSIDQTYEEGWGDPSKASYTNLEKSFAEIRSGLDGIDGNKLNEEEQIDRQLLVLELDNELNDLRFQSWLMPLNAEGGFLTGIVYWAQRADVSREEAQKKYLNKLKSLPGYLQSMTRIMQLGMESRKISPNIITQRCVDLLKNYLDTPPENSFLLSAFQDDSHPVKTEAIGIIKNEVWPALNKFRDFLQSEYLPASTEEPGISHLDGGKSFYEAKVRYYTTLDMSPDEVFNTGESEVKRIRSEMEDIIRKTGFRGDFADFLAFLRKDPQFYAKTPRELLYRATWLSKKIEGKLPAYFNKLPRMPFVVEPVPEAIAPNYTGGRYSEGSYKTGKPGAYWVNTYKLESRPLYVLPALTLHEAVPGHHLQIMLSRELENVPKFREQLYISAFGEGWGLYSEYLGIEAGMYETLYEDFGRLTYEMWRACRLVVDAGLHYKGWSRQQAVDYMAANTALSLHEVNTEIDRYIGWPGQAVSYKIGELKIKELRKKAEAALGDRFDIRSFHDLLLSKGSVSLSILEQMVNQYINTVKTQT